MNRRNFLKLGAKAGAAVGAVTVGGPVLAKAVESPAAVATVQPQTFEEWLRERSQESVAKGQEAHFVQGDGHGGYFITHDQSDQIIAALGGRERWKP